MTATLPGKTVNEIVTSLVHVKLWYHRFTCIWMNDTLTEDWAQQHMATLSKTLSWITTSGYVTDIFDSVANRRLHLPHTTKDFQDHHATEQASVTLRFSMQSLPELAIFTPVLTPCQWLSHLANLQSMANSESDSTCTDMYIYVHICRVPVHCVSFVHTTTQTTTITPPHALQNDGALSSCHVNPL